MVRCEKDSADKWEDLVKKAAATGRTLILNCTCPECAKKALAICKDGKPILNGATPENHEEMSAIATEAGVTLGVHADSLSELHDLSSRPRATRISSSTSPARPSRRRSPTPCSSAAPP